MNTAGGAAGFQENFIDSLPLRNIEHLARTAYERLGDIGAIAADNPGPAVEYINTGAADDIGGAPRCRQSAELLWADGNPAARGQGLQTVAVFDDAAVVTGPQAGETSTDQDEVLRMIFKQIYGGHGLPLDG